MIRINLLPVRAAKKKESVRFQFTVAGLITFLIFSVSMAAYLTVRSEASGLNDQLAKGNEELEQLKKKIGELSKIKEQKRIVEEKLNIITKLEAARTGPVTLFNKISDAIPDKAWLLSMRDEGYVITIKGYAANDEIVADFMRGLQQYKDLGTVELEVAERVIERETGADLVSFSLRLERPKEQPEKGKEKK
ncbi:MAG: PilN domain-containing protein [Deltaproteobacteria bacterium]|nr:PilN domain-containing protein [Deltaproteobacteria bacterium]